MPTESLIRYFVWSPVGSEWVHLRESAPGPCQLPREDCGGEQEGTVGGKGQRAGKLATEKPGFSQHSQPRGGQRLVGGGGLGGAQTCREVGGSGQRVACDVEIKRTPWQARCEEWGDFILRLPTEQSRVEWSGQVGLAGHTFHVPGPRRPHSATAGSTCP